MSGQGRDSKGERFRRKDSVPAKVSKFQFHNRHYEYKYNNKRPQSMKRITQPNQKYPDKATASRASLIANFCTSRRSWHVIPVAVSAVAWPRVCR